MKSEHRERTAQSKAQIIEWQVCEDEREWQRAQTLLVETSMPVAQQWSRQRVLRWGVPSLFCVLLLGFTLGSWLWSGAQAGLDQMETELQAATVAEAWSGSATGSTGSASPHNVAPLAASYGR
jgi:hypothetical protein